jgi:hypothetical protein
MNSIIDTTDVLCLSLGDKIEHCLKLTQNISVVSQHLEETSLKVLAGSVILLLGSDYVKPIKSQAKLIYLLFIPAWISLAISFVYSNALSRINASLIRFNKLQDIKSLIYDEGGFSEMYKYQSFYFFLGIIFLSAWLISYLIWWVFNDKQIKSKKV